MSLEVGSRLGHYDVTALIGEGGMGQVYQATDTKLKRQVALKILPEAFSADPERLARFQREAEVLASLNHPNIAAIYGLEEADDVRALVLELVEGPTLADRIKRGPIPLDEALPIAKQIAEALEAAHEAGVIHRDLKPANIKVRDDGTVKVLDFGLAKAFQPDASDPSLSQSPTISLTAAATQMGMVLGTAAYMAPEQASGKVVDKRADVWAFGVVLYEMLTGTRPFVGNDVSKTLARVIDRDPDWSALPKNLPPVLGTFLRGCLEKDPKQRVHDIADVRLAMEGAFETGVPQVAAAIAVAQPVWRQSLPVAAAALLAGVLVAGLVAWSLRPTAEVPRVTRLTIAQPDAQPLSLSIGYSPMLALSPDGTRAVYRVLVDDQPALVVRPFDALENTVLYEGDVFDPFFSPDGAWVGFKDNAGGSTIKRVAVTGGPALTISAVGSGRMAGATLGEDDTIIFGTGSSSGLWHVPAGGGTPEPLTTLDESQGESNHEWPELLPGGEAVLFTLRHTGDDADTAQIVVWHLGTGEQRVLVSGGSYPKYVPTGHLVYAFAGTLRAVPFDLDLLTVTGNPVGVLEGVVTKPSGAAEVAVAQNGSLVYAAGVGEGGILRTLVWVERDGREEPLSLPAGAYRWPRLSPDGARLAVNESGEGAWWVYDVASGRGLKLTQEGSAGAGIWTPDGERFVFGAGEEGSAPKNIYWARADGSGAIEALTTFESGEVLAVVPTGITPDGQTLIFGRAQEGGQIIDVWALPLDGEHTPTPLLQRGFQLVNGRVSPDGRWLSYQSNEAGQQDVYLQPYPDLGPITRVSIGGGTGIRWSPDGSELFYRNGTAMMATTVDRANGGATVGTQRQLFDGNYVAGTALGSPWYHVAPDGRFLMMKAGDALTTDNDVPNQVVLVLNWFEELKRLVPVP